MKQILQFCATILLRILSLWFSESFASKPFLTLITTQTSQYKQFSATSHYSQYLFHETSHVKTPFT